MRSQYFCTKAGVRCLTRRCRGAHVDELLDAASLDHGSKVRAPGRSFDSSNGKSIRGLYLQLFLFFCPVAMLGVGTIHAVGTNQSCSVQTNAVRLPATFRLRNIAGRRIWHNFAGLVRERRVDDCSGVI